MVYPQHTRPERCTASLQCSHTTQSSQTRSFSPFSRFRVPSLFLRPSFPHHSFGNHYRPASHHAGRVSANNGDSAVLPVRVRRVHVASCARHAKQAAPCPHATAQAYATAASVTVTAVLACATLACVTVHSAGVRSAIAAATVWSTAAKPSRRLSAASSSCNSSDIGGWYLPLYRATVNSAGRVCVPGIVWRSASIASSTWPLVNCYLHDILHLLLPIYCWCCAADRRMLAMRNSALPMPRHVVF